MRLVKIGNGKENGLPPEKCDFRAGVLWSRIGEARMNGFFAKWAPRVTLATGGLVSTCGCYTYHDLVDPCYPQRYEFMARHEVKEAFCPQVQNGHVLDQTMWNWQFEPGTPTLTQAGMEHLAYLARRRPAPDPTIYLQVAEDVTYDPANPMKMAEARTQLDTRRTQAILDYLATQTAGRPVTFTVVRHDPNVSDLSAVPVNTSVLQYQGSAQGVMLKPGGGTGTANVSGGTAK
jgi:hypothetical protein